MIKSMTGFASAAATAENIAVTVEMRTYNSRNLDLSLRVSPGDPGLEERIRALLSGRLVRGRGTVGRVLPSRSASRLRWHRGGGGSSGPTSTCREPRSRGSGWF